MAGRASKTCLPIGRGWPRLEAALSWTWRWRGVSKLEGEWPPPPLGGYVHVAPHVEVERGVDPGQHPLEVDVGVALYARGVCRVLGAAADLTSFLLQCVEDAAHHVLRRQA